MIDPNAQALALQCRAVGGIPDPLIDTYRFHSTRKWRIDLYFPECIKTTEDNWDYSCASLAVEIEGGAWINGRHTRGKGYLDDMEKYNEMTLAGIRLLRVTPAMVQDGTALGLIERAFGRVRE
jgi:hypothetical protein